MINKKCAVKIAGYTVDSGSLDKTLDYAVFTLLLYHGLLLHYTHRGERCFMLEVLSHTYRFGCHHKTAEKIEVVKDFFGN